jgi:BlaI family transcriptional regulator, penicillinase repressor
MKCKPLDDLGELQRTVLETVWELGEASVHEVRERLNRTKQLAYTTVLSAMQKLEKAGWLNHRAQGKSYVYFATQTRDQAGAGSVRRLVKRLFDGDALAMFSHLIRTSDLSENDLLELRKMINERKQEMRQ